MNKIITVLGFVALVALPTASALTCWAGDLTNEDVEPDDTNSGLTTCETETTCYKIREEWDGDLLNSHYGCEDTYDTYVSTIITPRSSDIDLDTPDANKCSKAKASDIKYNTTSDETAKYNVKACKCDESDKCNSADRSLAGLTALVAATVFSRLF